MSQNRVIVIGGDAAGMSAASRAKRRKPELEFTVYEQGDFVSYAACGMPYFVGGQVGELEKLIAVTREEFETKRGIRVFMRHRVEKIDPQAHKVTVHDLTADRRFEAEYDKLVIATGAQALVPPPIDLSLPNVFTVQSLNSARDIREKAAAKPGQKALIVGAGYIGLEMAEGLTSARAEVTTIVRGDRVMSRLDSAITDQLKDELDAHGVRLLTGTVVKSIEAEPDGGLMVDLGNGPERFDMVVVGIGVTPRAELAEAAGIKLGAHGAIAVDRQGRTSAPDIWSAGDCATAYNRQTDREDWIALALCANRAGRIVGDDLAGQKAEFPGIIRSSVTKVFDLTAASTGLNQAALDQMGIPYVRAEVVTNSRPHYYPGVAPVKTVVYADFDYKVWGVQMVGRDGIAHRMNTWATAISAGLTLPQIADLDLVYAPPFSPVWDPVLVAADVAGKQVAKQAAKRK